MNQFAKRFFTVGLLLALLFGYLRARGSTAWLVAWLFVGGVGLLCGVFDFSPKEMPRAFLSLIGLVVALSAVLLQDFNPKWLSDIVFYLRVFFAHFLLSFSFLQLVKTGNDPQEDS